MSTTILKASWLPYPAIRCWRPNTRCPAPVQQSIDLVISPVPGWKGQVPTWFGISCRIGRVSLWLPIQEQVGQYREFSLLALLPRDDLKEAPPFVHLGAQFLVEYRGRLFLECASTSNQVI
jgi:hypothetical protein